MVKRGLSVDPPDAHFGPLVGMENANQRAWDFFRQADLGV
jgi:hypothetical protein